MLDVRTTTLWLAIVDDADDANRLIAETRSGGDEVIAPIPRSALEISPEAEIWARSDNAGAAAPFGDPLPFAARSSDRASLQCVVLNRQGDAGGDDVATAFPFAVSGPQAFLEVRAVTPFDDGAGAMIAAGYQGAELIFCDPIFYMDKKRLRIGEIQQFTLTAIAFWVDPVSPEQLAEWGITPNVALIQPDRPAGDDEAVEPDWRRFYGAIKSIDHTEFDGLPITILDVRVVDGEPSLHVSVYAAPKALPEDFHPQPGDVITGAVWATGYLSGSWPHMPSSGLDLYSRI